MTGLNCSCVQRKFPTLMVVLVVFFCCNQVGGQWETKRQPRVPQPCQLSCLLSSNASTPTQHLYCHRGRCLFWWITRMTLFLRDVSSGWLAFTRRHVWNLHSTSRSRLTIWMKLHHTQLYLTRGETLQKPFRYGVADGSSGFDITYVTPCVEFGTPNTRGSCGSTRYASTRAASPRRITRSL